MTDRNRHVDPEPSLGPALDFLRRLWQLDHGLERLSSRMERELGITAQQRLIVRCVGQHAGIGPGRLAALLHLDPGTVSATLKRLQDKRLLERRQDPADRRRFMLTLTAAGRALDHPTEHTVERAVERLIATTTPDELQRTVTVLERLIACVEGEVVNGGAG